MNDELIPPWIKKIKDAEDSARDKAALESARDLADRTTIQAGAPKFWKELAKDLEIAAHALARINVTATCSSLGGEEPRPSSDRRAPEHGVRVDMQAGFPRVKIGYVNIWYTEGTYHLRVYCTKEEQEPEQKIRLGLNRTGEVCAFTNGSPLDAEQTAEAILSPLATYVRS
jgi:hypothetical protein